MKPIGRIHIDYPFYGFRRIRNGLRSYGFNVGKKPAIGLMKLVAIEAVYPERNTSGPCSGDRIYPYLSGGLPVEHCHRAWEMDITYVSMYHGFMYLAAIIDVHGRPVVHRDVSSTKEADRCRGIVAEAIAGYGAPGIFNTDRGSQFTGHVFTGCLIENRIKTGMDGRGRATDNAFMERLRRSVKRENIYLNACENGREPYAGLKGYFDFYSHKRPHRSLDYKCPASDKLIVL
jgi:putative transposase